MIKLKRIVKDNGFILEEIDSNKINKELIKDGEMEPADLPHVENNPESAQEHIDDVKEIVDKENEEEEKVALETKTKDYIIEPKELKESKFFKDRSEMTPFIVKLKEQKIRHRVVPLHEDKEGYKFELKYEKPLNEQLNESYETAFEVLSDGSKVSAVGSFKHTRNYTHELVDFEWKNGSGSGDYRWMNRPWQRFTFAEALREAMINAGVDKQFAKEIIEESYSLKSAIKLFATRYEAELKDEPKKVEENLVEDLGVKQAWRTILVNLDKAGLYDSLENEINMVVKALKNSPLYEAKEINEEDKEEPKLETFDEQMDFLAKDEQEAIDGYEKVLALVDDEHVKAQLEKILEEERAHKEFLEAVKSDKTLEYSHEEAHEEDDDSIDDFNLEDDEVIIDKEDDFSWDALDEEVVEEETKETLDEDLDDDIDSQEKEDDSKEDEEDDDDFKGLNEEITITNEDETISSWDDLED